MRTRTLKYHLATSPLIGSEMTIIPNDTMQYQPMMKPMKMNTPTSSIGATNPNMSHRPI